MTYRCKSCGALNNVKADHDGKPVCGRCKAPLDLSGAPQNVNGEMLERSVNAAPVPVLVDFWAPWCGPCLAVAPTVEHLAHERAGKLLVLKLDTEREPAAAGRHRVQSIPTFALFAKGRELGRRSGALSKLALNAWITSLT